MRLRVAIAFAVMFAWAILMDPGDMVGRLTLVAGGLGMAVVMLVDALLEQLLEGRRRG